METPAPRIQRGNATPEQLLQIAGDYYSEELGVVYTLFVRAGALILRYPRGEITLEAVQPDYFIGGYPVQPVYFTHGPAGGPVTGFHLDTGRVRNLSFERAQLPAAPATIAEENTMSHVQIYHFSSSEPGKRIVVQRGPGKIRVTNTGPSGVLVQNGSNHMLLGAHTQADLARVGKTVITMDPAEMGGQTSGEVEIIGD